MIKICMHSSNYIDVTVVHPLLGYVHKDLALVSFIMVVQHIQRRVFTILLGWVICIGGELDRTRPLILRPNPQDLPSLISSISTTYKIMHNNITIRIHSYISMM